MRDRAVIGTAWEEEQRACGLVSWAGPLRGARTRGAGLVSFGRIRKDGPGQGGRRELRLGCQVMRPSGPAASAERAESQREEGKLGLRAKN
jgi:hypothetical protein